MTINNKMHILEEGTSMILSNNGKHYRSMENIGRNEVKSYNNKSSSAYFFLTKGIL